MVRLHLVRHGRAAAGWSEDADPGLDDLGQQQAKRVADDFTDGPELRIVASPLRRTRETAAPLASMWGIEPVIDDRIAEIPSPIDDLEGRGIWLRDVMGSSWPDLDEDLHRWRLQLLWSLTSTPADTVFFTHFIAINVAVGAATRNDRVVHITPENGSVTVLETDGEELRVVETGEQADWTRVN